jgi:hypothetical protein
MLPANVNVGAVDAALELSFGSDGIQSLCSNERRLGSLPVNRSKIRCRSRAAWVQGGRFDDRTIVHSELSGSSSSVATPISGCMGATLRRRSPADATCVRCCGMRGRRREWAWTLAADGPADHKRLWLPSGLCRHGPTRPPQTSAANFSLIQIPDRTSTMGEQAQRRRPAR